MEHVQTVIKTVNSFAAAGTTGRDANWIDVSTRPSRDPAPTRDIISTKD